MTKLVGAQDCINIVFKDAMRKPGFRTFREWQAKGLIPFRKIGRLTFFDPVEVRAAIDKRCRVQALEY
jgi:hypothetical protein